MTPAEFFFTNAGYSYNPKAETPEQGRTRCAQRLAEAEAAADSRGWWVEWIGDDGEEDGAPRWCALLRDNNNTVLGSLGGLDVCDGPYARVVAAELAADVF